MSLSYVIRPDSLMIQVGIGIQDVAVAALVLEQAQSAGLGTIIADYDTTS